MDLIHRCVQRCVWFLCVLKVTVTWTEAQTASLTPTSPSVYEGDALTFTCTIQGSTPNYRWRRTDVVGNDVRVGIIDTNCLELGTPVDNSVYQYACPEPTRYTWTIRQVTRNENNVKWSCLVVINNVIFVSNSVTVQVKVPISGITLTLPTDTIVTINENSKKTFICKTSGGLPSATVRWFIEAGSISELTAGISNDESTNNDNLTLVTSTLEYTAIKGDNNRRIYCTANNTDDIKTSRKITLTVQYSPNGPPQIQNVVSGVYKIIENIDETVTCSIIGGNPLPTLSWSCIIGVSETSTTSGKTVSLPITLNANRNQGTTCLCRSSHIVAGAQDTDVSIQVLYPPSTPTFQIDNKAISGTNIKLIEGNTKSVKCISTGNPDPDTSSNFTWTGQGNGWELSWQQGIQRENTGMYTCNVHTTMFPSRGDTVLGTASAQVDIEVLYPPSAPKISCGSTNTKDITNQTIDAEEGISIHINCSTEANPPAGYQWLQVPLTDNTVVPYRNTGSLICRASNTMSPSDINTGVFASKDGHVSFNINYAPENINILYQPPGGQISNIDQVVKIIHGEPLHLDCSAVSEPVALYHWNGTLTSSSGVLNIQSVPKDKRGELICHAINSVSRPCLTPSTVERQNEKKINLDILYPPVVNSISPQNALEQTSFTLPCGFEAGNPGQSNITWKRASDDRTWTNLTLQLSSVDRMKDDTTFTCTASNTMVPTAESQQQGRDSKSFHLNVWYKTYLDSFIVIGAGSAETVTKNEDEDAHFKCNVTSNPVSNINIERHGKLLKKNQNDQEVTYRLLKSSCDDAGVYTCRGTNNYTDMNDVPTKYITYFVRCSPRQSPHVNQKTNITSGLRQNVTLKFTAQAYPVPGPDNYIWQRCNTSNTSNCSIIKHDGLSRLISTQGLQTNLTIINVQESDIGKYTLNISNGIGKTLEQHFFLAPQDRPSAPTNFQYSEGTLRETSVTVTWVPGFNGGLTQTFVIQYKTGTEHSWTTVEDIPAQTTNHNLIGLSSGTIYTAHMYAYNRINESDRTENITFTTVTAKLIVTASEGPPNNAALIGGAVGGSVVAIIIAVLVAVILLKIRKQGLARTAKERQTATYTDLTIPGNTSNIYDPIQRETNFSGDAANKRSESLNVDGSNNMYAGLSQYANLQNTYTSLDNINSCNKQSNVTYANMVISPK